MCFVVRNAGVTVELAASAVAAGENHKKNVCNNFELTLAFRIGLV